LAIPGVPFLAWWFLHLPLSGPDVFVRWSVVALSDLLSFLVGPFFADFVWFFTGALG